MFFYDNWILNPKLAPNWFTNVKVFYITPNPRVSGTGQLANFSSPDRLTENLFCPDACSDVTNDSVLTTVAVTSFLFLIVVERLRDNIATNLQGKKI